MNLRFLQRDNRCEMNGVCEQTNESLHRGDGSYPCFHAAFEFVSRHPNYTYDIEYKLCIKKVCDGYYNNFAVLSKKDMCRILNSIKYVVPFTFHFEESYNYYIVHMKLEGTSMQHKGLLMFSRMLFEFPHNMIAKDLLEIRNKGMLEDVDISKYSLLQLYILCISSTNFSTDECFIRTNRPKIVSTEFIRKTLKRTDRKTISRVVPSKNYRGQLFSWPGDTDTRDSEENITKRIHTYAINLKANLNA